MSGTKVYRVWESMLAVSRRNGCFVEPYWYRFENFFCDMPPPPHPENYMFRQIQKGVGYTKENCKWFPKN